MKIRVQDLATIPPQVAGGKGEGLLAARSVGARIPMTLVIDRAVKGTGASARDILDLPGIVAEQFPGVRRFAVRSSASVEDRANSWAGQFLTHLNVSLSNIVVAVRAVFKSRSSTRVRSYSSAHGLSKTPIDMAVLIQPMVEGRIMSGIGFSNDIVFDRKGLIIEASTKGEAVVSGKVNPYRLHFNEKGDRLLMGSVPEKLMPGIRKAAMWTAKLRDKLGFEVDIEWTVNKAGQLVILQCRPLEKSFLRKIGWWSGSRKDYFVQYSCSEIPVFFVDLLMQCYRKMRQVFTYQDGKFIQHASVKHGVKLLKKAQRVFGTVSSREALGTRIQMAADLLTAFPLNVEIAQLEKHCVDLIELYSLFDSVYVDAIANDVSYREAIRWISEVKDHYRMLVNKLIVKRSGVLWKCAVRLARGRGIPSRTTAWLTLKELNDKTQSVENLEKLAQLRSEGYAITGNPKEHVWLQGLNAIPVLREMRREDIGRLRALKGNVACRGSGNLQGKVRILRINLLREGVLEKAIKSMKKGEILVSETTSPELSAAFSKAAGIVTDVGGLLSHAAIVSRSMNLPCIVGVKHATQLLHNGETIRLDVDSGRIIRVGQTQSPRLSKGTSFRSRRNPS